MLWLDSFPKIADLFEVGQDQIHRIGFHEGVLAALIMLNEVGNQGLLDMHQVYGSELVIQSFYNWRVRLHSN